MGALQELDEAVHADSQRNGQSDCRPEGITPADPIPEAEHVLRIDTERDDPGFIGGHRDEVVGDRRLAAQGLHQPGPGAVGVRHGLHGREGLGGNHEQGGRGIEGPYRLGKVGTIHIGDEMHPQVFGLVGKQGLAYHQRP